MMTLSDYTELSEQIHAPDHLKAKVLEAAGETGREKKRSYRGIYNRGWSALQKAAAATIILFCLPVTAYAAVKGFGILDHLRQLGVEENQLQGMEQLAVDPTEVDQTVPASANMTQYVSYSVEEAIIDSGTIMISGKMTPLHDEYLLIPSIAFSEDEFTIDGVNVGTAEEYAAATGKTPLYVGLYFGDEEGIINGAGYSYELTGDGSVYIYCSAANIFGAKEFTVHCSGTAYTPDMPLADQVEFDVLVADNSTSREQVFTQIDPDVLTQTGIRVERITFEETQMGLYVTFRYAYETSKWEFATFRLVDGAGEELRNHPGFPGSGEIDNGDGTFSFTWMYLKPDQMEGLQFRIRDVYGDVSYGPYTFG